MQARSSRACGRDHNLDFIVDPEAFMNAAARAGTLAVNLKSERFRRMVQNTVGGSAMCDSVHGAVSRRAAIYFYYQYPGRVVLAAVKVQTD